MKKTVLFLLVCLLPFPAAALEANDPSQDQWGYTSTRAYDAWDLGTGSRDVVVAVIDNGIDATHPDLQENMWTNPGEIPNNGIDDDENGYIDDVHGWSFVPKDLDGDGEISNIERIAGHNNPSPNVSEVNGKTRRSKVLHHGTAVAGIIGAVGNNGRDGAGINWKVRIMNIQLLNSNGAGGFAEVDRAIRYAVDNGAHVINMSLVGVGNEDNLEEAIDYAYSRGVVLVAAAGNKSRDLNADPRYPVCSDKGSDEVKVIGVSAMMQSRQLARFSNRGSDCIDITAPGVLVGSTALLAPEFDLNESFEEGFSGTSFAAPYVSGAAALVKAIQPSWGAKEINAALLNTTYKTPADDEELYANYFGRGLLQIDAAVAYAVGNRQDRPEIERLMMVQVDNGLVIERDVLTGKSKRRSVWSLRGVERIVRHIHKGKVYTATLTKLEKNAYRVVVFDEHWKHVTSWTTSQIGEIDIAMADVTGDGALNIVLYPKHENDELFNIYTLEGSILNFPSVRWTHQGVSVALIEDAPANRYDIAVAYHNADGVLQVSRLNAEGKYKHTFEVPTLESAAALRVGDIDGDRADEYVLLAGSGVPTMLYYEQTGKLKRRFTAYAGGLAQTLEVLIGDVDGNDEDDVLVLPISDDQPIRIWNGAARKVDVWPLETAVAREKTRLVPVFSL